MTEATGAEQRGCALCGLDVGRAPVLRTIGGEEHGFCCAGCAATYEFAYRNGQLEWVLERLRAVPQSQRRLLAGGEKVYFAVEGMYCAACAPVVERILASQPGVTAAEVSYALERGYLRYDPEQITAEAALSSLERVGYRCTLHGDADEARAERRHTLVTIRFVLALGLGMTIMAIYLNQLYHFYAAGQFDTSDTRGYQYLSLVVATPLLVVCGGPFVLGAYRALKGRTATMDTLVSLGILSAFGYSLYITLNGGGQAYYDSVAMIITFVTLGRMMEALGGLEARKDIRKLLGLQPNKAWRKGGESWQEVPAGDLVEGDVVLVKPGERVPADAEVMEGEGALDEALLTGESTPVNKGVGEHVFAGTLLADSALVCRVLKPAADARLAQIARLVEHTLAAKPPIQRLADRAAAYLALGVLAVAVMTAVGWSLGGYAPSEALLTSVAVLVVACPCALGLATPLALTITLGKAAQDGILVRNPAALESASHVDRIVFDKTGTLTRGQMAVTGVEVAPGVELSREGLLRLAAGVEQFSEHPIARAIVAAAPGAAPAAGEFETARGLGASAEVGSELVRVGTLRYLDGTADGSLVAQEEARARRGETVVWLSRGGVVAGLVALRDEPRPGAARALRALEEMGVQTEMLSGDSPVTAQAIADELGLAACAGHCSPQDKAARIEAYQKAGERVAMIGDGVNDAPALARADLSFTAAGGTDVAGEASDVVFARSDLGLVAEFLRLTRRTRRAIMMSLGWALAYNLVTVPLAAFGAISPAIAAATMTASSLLVVGNSLRLRQ